jgi:MFS transporter, PPP family, 3-phenylpropionic acid transporter
LQLEFNLKPTYYSAAFYFIYFAALAALMPFLALYYQSINIPAGQIGLLLACPPLITLVASPFWTGLADASHRHRLVLSTTLLGVILMTLVIPLSGASLWLFPVVIAFAFFGAPAIPLVDNATMSMLGDKRDSYGRIRVWGTFGWAIMAPIAGVIFQKAGLQWMFIIYALMMALNLIVANRIVFTRVIDSTPFWKGISVVLNNPSWVLFLFVAFVAGIGLATINSYLFVLMQSLGMDKSLMGIALAISTISEIPVLFFGSFFLRHLKPQGLIILSMAVTGLRCILYYFIDSPTVILLIQLIQGFTYPAFFLGGVSFVAENSPPGLGATTQGLFSSMSMGFGAAAGSLIGGILIGLIGPEGMYGVIGVGTLVSLGIFFIFQKRMK